VKPPEFNPFQADEQASNAFIRGDQVTPIERIRAEVEGMRKEHVKDPALSHRICNQEQCYSAWPCPTLRLAEDKLKLAEALALLPCDCPLGHMVDAEFCPYGRAERVLAEVAR
jgi:hypothetical protein